MDIQRGGNGSGRLASTHPFQMGRLALPSSPPSHPPPLPPHHQGHERHWQEAPGWLVQLSGWCWPPGGPPWPSCASQGTRPSSPQPSKQAVQIIIMSLGHYPASQGHMPSMHIIHSISSSKPHLMTSPTAHHNLAYYQVLGITTIPYEAQLSSPCQWPPPCQPRSGGCPGQRS